jgi:hypothetical protein
MSAPENPWRPEPPPPDPPPPPPTLSELMDRAERAIAENQRLSEELGKTIAQLRERWGR